MIPKFVCRSAWEDNLRTKDSWIISPYRRTNRGITIGINCRESLLFTSIKAGQRSTVGRASDSRTKSRRFDTRSGHTLSFLLPLVQEGHLSVTGESMCTKYWLIA